MRDLQKMVVVLAVVASLGTGCRKPTDDVVVDAACATCPEKATEACATCPTGAAEQVAAVAAGPAAQVDGAAVVVTVGGEVLTEAEAAGIMRQMVAQQGIPPQMADQFMEQLGPQLREQVISQFIDRTLVLQEAKSRNIEVTDAEIETTLDQFRGQIPEGMTLEEAVKAQGYSMEQLRDDARNEELTRKLFEAETAHVVAPTDEQVAAFYTEHPEHFVKEEQAHARHILIGCTEEEGAEARAAAKVKAEALRKSLVDGADFAEVARENSTCNSAQQGGDLGTFARGAMVPAFEEAAFSQEKDAIGEVIETQFGYHIVQVLERTEAGTTPLEEVAGDIRGFLERRGKGEAFQAFAGKLREGAEIVYPTEQAQ